MMMRLQMSQRLGLLAVWLACAVVSLPLHNEPLSDLALLSEAVHTPEDTGVQIALSVRDGQLQASTVAAAKRRKASLEVHQYYSLPAVLTSVSRRRLQ